MSMRLKLGLEPDELTDKTRFIIVKVEGASIGVIVDQVKEVVTLEEEDIERISDQPMMMRQLTILMQ